MKIPLLPDSATNKIGNSYITNVERGVVCFDFSKHNPDIFVVGLEGGLVVQCSTLSPNELKGERVD